MSFRTAALLVAAWIVLLLVTHTGGRSPYTYAAQMFHPDGVQSQGLIANPDTHTVYGVTRFFYDGTTPDYPRAHNLWLPLHSFSVAIAGGFVRHYLAANYLVNALFFLLVAMAGVRLAERFRIRAEAMLIALLTWCAMPMFVACLGQPMHYVVGPSISFLVLLTVLALPEDDLRNPLIPGALTAILTLNYHWYMFVAALVIYLLFVVRFRRLLDVLFYAIVAGAPMTIWEWFLGSISDGRISLEIRSSFFYSTLANWLLFLKAPHEHLVLPYIVTHIGSYVAFHHVVAVIHWPVLAIAIYGSWKARDDASGFRGNRLVLLLAAFFLLEQLVSAAFDWEKNPRRAFPLLFAFGYAYCWIVNRFFDRKWWKIAFVAMLALTAFLAFVDVAFQQGGGAFLYMGEAVRSEPDAAVALESRKLPATGPVTPDPQPLIRPPLPPARPPLSFAFVFAQAFVGCWFVALFAFVARAGLLPRSAPVIACALWGVSLAVRLLG